jgi:hypothetical protein
MRPAIGALEDSLSNWRPTLPPVELAAH